MKYNTLERTIHLSDRDLNQYSLRADSFVDIELPNGDDLRLYASEDGDYVSITVKTHRRTGLLESKSENDDFDDFTTQRESIKTSLYNGKWTQVQFTAFHDKETEDETSKPKRITLSGNFDYDRIEDIVDEDDFENYINSEEE